MLYLYFIIKNLKTMNVISKVFGQGTVISQDAQNVTVDFNGNVKILVIAYARLTNEDGTPFGEEYVAPVKKQMSEKKRREKLSITASGSFNDCFKSVEERENWKIEREKKNRQTISY